MKIRIKGNSIRLRLSKTEVANFGTLGYLEEFTEIGTQQFTYALAKSNSAKHLHASLTGQKITLHVPESIATEWTNTDIVGFQHIELLPSGKELFLLLEKDFVCLDNTFEDQSDNYPNPNAHC